MNLYGKEIKGFPSSFYLDQLYRKRNESEDEKTNSDVDKEVNQKEKENVSE